MTSLSKQLNTAQKKKTTTYRHAIWLLIVPLSLVLFAFVEKYVATGKYNVMYLPVDSRIPFIPAFIIPYSLWYPALLAIGLHHFFRDPDAFRRYLWSFGFTYAIAIFIYIVFPNGQNLRPNVHGVTGVFTALISILYEIDTNTNVFPSIHTIGAMLIVFAVLDSNLTCRPRYIFASLLFFLLTAASTVHIKQHSIADVYGGIAVGAAIYIIIYVGIKRIQINRRSLGAHKSDKGVNYRNC